MVRTSGLPPGVNMAAYGHLARQTGAPHCNSGGRPEVRTTMEHWPEARATIDAGGESPRPFHTPSQVRILVAALSSPTRDAQET